MNHKIALPFCLSIFWIAPVSAAPPADEGGCLFVGQLDGKEFVLNDIGVPKPMGIYGSNKDKTYNWCLVAPQPNGPIYLLCHSKPHGPETVYYEYSHRKASVGDVFTCKTGCDGAVVQEFVQVCNEGG